jgi:hypothetical protein
VGEAFGDDIWVFDGPPVSFVGLPYPTRMTVIRLADGGLFVHSPIELTDSLRAEIDALGPVRHLVSPNKLHHLFVQDWHTAYPEALTWAAPGVRKKTSVEWDGDLEDVAPAPWRDQIDQLIFRGSVLLDEVVFFHRRSRTLVLVDLVQDFDPAPLSRSLRLLFRVIGALHPNGQAPVDFRLSFFDRQSARDCLQRLLAWEPERVVIAHGLCARERGQDWLRHHFRWLA